MDEERAAATSTKPEKSETAPAPMPVKQGVVMEIIALVMVIAVTVLATVMGCAIWIVWLGMCLWAGLGHMKVEIGEIVRAWTGGAFGIGLGYLLTHSSEVGSWVLPVAAVILILFIFGMVTHRWGWFCNNYTACFLTVCTAWGLPISIPQVVLSLVYGFVVFGIIPLAATKLMASRKTADKQKA
ncbi:hypothetical protein [Tractidigestivibacter montrealensis]|uniref:DUF1097 domain-containing protein n=1 Tax=Tractidigestivibacter montrealensis TaxID=2972466 RepID=A0ABT1Z9A9_9ACTN|nr:hypothetical protein [Tractidigestivibacter montrealensis]MCR9036804.1 hypothetical protein [Tractidigestivibacter montrealensis]